jgi:GNAT superfamily N-acetyltransferase
VTADGALPVPGVYGVPAQWPHVERLYTESGFSPGRIEILHLADLDRLPAPGGPPLPGLVLQRRVGMVGVRLSACLNGGDVGFVEVEVLDGAERHPRLGGLADIGDLHVAECHQRQGVGGWLLAHAAAWLRLAHVDRLLSYADPEDTVLLAFIEKHGFTELTRTRRGWERPAG